MVSFTDGDFDGAMCTHALYLYCIGIRLLAQGHVGKLFMFIPGLYGFSARKLGSWSIDAQIARITCRLTASDILCDGCEAGQ